MTMFVIEMTKEVIFPSEIDDPPQISQGKITAQLGLAKIKVWIYLDYIIYLDSRLDLI